MLEGIHVQNLYDKKNLHKGFNVIFKFNEKERYVYKDNKT